MNFKRFWYRTKRNVKRAYKKVKKAVKRYIRLLVRHTKAKDYSVLMYTIGGVIVLILLIILLGKGIGAIKNAFSDDSDSTTEEITTEITTTESTELSPEEIMANEAKRIYELDKNYLILVNKLNPIPADYTFNHHTLNCGYDIVEEIYADFLAMMEACNAAGFHYNILSAYRPDETIQPIDDANDNTSEHKTGLAVDICTETTNETSDALATDPVCMWLAENCHSYGFVLRYPKDKTDITGMAYQPWHFRYVGKNAAIFMKENNLTLEEFHDLLTR